MELRDEDITGILVRDLPKASEYEPIIDKIRKSAQLSGTNFEQFLEVDYEIRRDFQLLMARCIARGMRLALEDRATAAQKRGEA